MTRLHLVTLAAALASAGVTGAAAAQPGYDSSEYAQPRAYPQTPQAGRQTGASPYDSGYEDDGDRAPAPGGPGDGAYGGDTSSQPDLGRELGLRGDQRAALQAYQQATTPSDAERQRDEADAQRVAAMTTPQRLDFIAAQMRRDQADFARRADAVRRFYGQLSPDQQRRFDQLTSPQASYGGADNEEGGGMGASPPPR